MVHQAQKRDKVHRLLLFGRSLHIHSSEKGCKNPVAVKADRLTKLVLLVSLLMDCRFTVLVEINLYLIASGAQALKQGE